MKSKPCVLAAVSGISLALIASVAGAQEDGEEPAQFFKVFPIGTVQKEEGTTYLKIADQYVDGLKGLDGFSHVVVLYWFDKNDTPSKRSILQVHPRRLRNNPLTGVFACRAPVRPNLIALSVCKILSIEGATVRIADIDAFDDTPILDLKPHIPGIDSPTNATVPDWLRPAKPREGSAGGATGGKGFVERIMGFDANGDGKVSKDEMPKRMQERLLLRADTNNDGAIDRQEAGKVGGRF